jgi:integrase
MKEYASPYFGSMRVSEISGGDVLKAVAAIWSVTPETARRVQQRIGTVFKWAIAHGYRTDNPATVAATTLPKHDKSRKKHHRALPYNQVRDAVATVQASKASPSTKLAFEFLVLTATRSAETRGAIWTEIDLYKGVWVIPRERMKTGREHRVPLSDPAATILEKALAFRVEGCDLLFPAKNICKPLSDVTISKLVKELGIAAVPHGFRSSFRDWAAEQTAYPPQVCEFALAHVISDKAEAAYFRSDLFEKRRLMMADWANYISVDASSNI